MVTAKKTAKTATPAAAQPAPTVVETQPTGNSTVGLLVDAPKPAVKPGKKAAKPTLAKPVTVTGVGRQKPTPKSKAKQPELDLARCHRTSLTGPTDPNDPAFNGIVYYIGSDKPEYRMSPEEKAIYAEVSTWEKANGVKYLECAAPGESWAAFKKRGAPTTKYETPKPTPVVTPTPQPVKPATTTTTSIDTAGTFKTAPTPRAKGSDLRKQVLALLYTAKDGLARSVLVAKTGVEKGWSKLLGAHTKGNCPTGTMIGDGLIRVDDKGIYHITNAGERLIGVSRRHHG
jgi:hypothetical protein